MGRVYSCDLNSILRQEEQDRIVPNNAAAALMSNDYAKVQDGHSWLATKNKSPKTRELNNKQNTVLQNEQI